MSEIIDKLREIEKLIRRKGSVRRITRLLNEVISELENDE